MVTNGTGAWAEPDEVTITKTAENKLEIKEVPTTKLKVIASGTTTISSGSLVWIADNLSGYVFVIYKVTAGTYNYNEVYVTFGQASSSGTVVGLRNEGTESCTVAWKIIGE